MKNSKAKKFLLAVLSAALLITATFGISALASTDESASDTPEIVSKNVKYGDTVYFMFAVPKTDAVTEENTVIEFYTEDPEENPDAKATTYSYYEVKTIANYGECITFVTGGVPVQYISTYAYAKPVSDGVEGEVIRYSILEYLYERLYTCECDDLQIALYNATLNYGIAAQANLVNKGLTADDEGYETPIGDLNYVYVDKALGTLDGKNYSGLYVDGTALTLSLDADAKPAQGYGITNIVNGESTHKKLRTDSLKVNNTLIIGNFVFDGETFENIDHPYASTTADSFGNLTLNGQSQITAWSAYTEGITDHGFGITADPENAANKVLAFRRNSIDEAATSKTAELYITPETVDTDYNAIVFEADLKFDYIKTGTVAFAFTDGQTFLFGTNDTNMTIRHNNSSITGIGDTYHDTGIAKGEWFNLRIEYYILDATSGITRTAIYINDTLFQLNNYTTASTSPTDLTKLTISGWSGVFFDMYMDNMAFRKINKEFVAPSYDFEGGTLPTGMNPYYWDSAASASKDSDYTVEDGKYTVNSVAGRADTVRFFATEQYSSFGNEDINSWVFEADIKAVGSAQGNGTQLIFRDNSSGTQYSFAFGLRANAGQAIWFGSGNTTPATDSTEFHLRLEYYISNETPNVRVYVNGAYQYTLTGTSANMPALANINQFRVAFSDTAVQDITFDNVRFYTANTTDPAN